MTNAEIVKGVDKLIDMIDIAIKNKDKPGSVNWDYVKVQIDQYADPLREHFGITTARIK
jgi:uncharacterized protein (UPF0212 family)